MRPVRTCADVEAVAAVTCATKSTLCATSAAMLGSRVTWTLRSRAQGRRTRSRQCGQYFDELHVRLRSQRNGHRPDGAAIAAQENSQLGLVVIPPYAAPIARAPAPRNSSWRYAR